MNSQTPLVIAVVVTYNRCDLLKECLIAIDAQTVRPNRVILVDGASTDSTEAFAGKWLDTDPERFTYLRLSSNLGGAGGFSEGLRAAMSGGPVWAWIMDDDAAPHPQALGALLSVDPDPENIYGSLAVNGMDTAWTTTLISGNKELQADLAEEVPPLAHVRSLPFLGFMIHGNLVSRIGLPDASYFIAGDDTEYCLRARAHGAKILVVGESKIEHPKSARRKVGLLGVRVAYLDLPPWKRYYDTRNRILTARTYHGGLLWTNTVPGTLLRLFVALTQAPDKRRQARAFIGGLIDGLRDKRGQRHTLWHL